jgi:hypothetical protein
MSLVQVQGNASGTGTLTIAAPNTNSNYTLTLPQTTATLGINGPAFSASPTTTQSVTTATFTKVNLGTVAFDTNSNFASSRFTPTVAGYYFFSGTLYAVFASSATYVWPSVYKNGSLAIGGTSQGVASTVDGLGTVNGLLYMNGSSDYVELYVYLSGTTPVSQSAYTLFSGFLARGA